MKQFTFESYEEYVEAQRRVTLNKLGRGNCFTRKAVADCCRQAMAQVEVKLGICHGVQKGGELELFRAAFGGEWLGTDIVSEALNCHKNIIQHDFETVRQEWIGSIDAIYSNALDHARRPWVAVKAWLSCLSETGCLFVEWTEWHNKLSRHGKKSDCFAASADEYHALLNSAGRVLGVIEVPDDECIRTIFQVR